MPRILARQLRLRGSTARNDPQARLRADGANGAYRSLQSGMALPGWMRRRRYERVPAIHQGTRQGHLHGDWRKEWSLDFGVPQGHRKKWRRLAFSGHLRLLGTLCRPSAMEIYTNEFAKPE